MSVFQFKQFSIRQEKSAMKVGTDGVILGAWSNVKNKKQVLDIGTGTGLLALMLAQRNPNVLIDAIEIEKGAFEEAIANVQKSKFKNQISVFHSDFEAFSPPVKYDLIISNPPYFFGQYQSKNRARNSARHGNSNWVDWIKKFSQLLSEKGEVHLISPIEDHSLIKSAMASNKLFPKAFVKVKPNTTKSHHRLLQSYSFKNNIMLVEGELIIEKSLRHQYTETYRELLRDYLTIF